MTDEELKMKSYIVITISVRFYNITGLKQNKKNNHIFPFYKEFPLRSCALSRWDECRARHNTGLLKDSLVKTRLTVDRNYSNKVATCIMFNRK